MNLLVTGGAGFIGSNFIHYILAVHPAYHIINLDKLTYAGNMENLKDIGENPRHSFVQGDICDAELVRSLLDERGIDAVVNFAPILWERMSSWRRRRLTR
jgi:dTDP-glucose 4,6-dehydratase